MYNKQKGEPNERRTANDQNRGQKRNGVVSEVSQEHERRVGAERQIISENVHAPRDLREACKNGQGIPGISVPAGLIICHWTEFC